MNDKELKTIGYLKEGKINLAMKSLYKVFPSIKTYITKNSGSKEDAEDIFQESIFILYEKVQKENMNFNQGIHAYLMTISKNLWYNQLRKIKKGNELNFEPSDEIEDLELEDKKYNLSEKAFKSLGEKCQELLLLFYYYKKSMQEIAKKLDFSNEKVAKNQKYKCLEKAKANYLTLINE